MRLDDSLPLAPSIAPDTGAAAKKKLIVDLEQLFCPEPFLTLSQPWVSKRNIMKTHLVKNVSSPDFRGHSSSEILDAFTTITTLDRGVVSVGLRIALLQKRQPSLLRMLTLGKVERATVGLVNPAIGLFSIDMLDILEKDSVKAAFVIVGFDEVELNGSAISFWHLDGELTKSSTISEIHSPSRWKTKP